METHIPTRSTDVYIRDTRKYFFNQLCEETGLTLIQSVLKNKCQCSTDNVLLKSKDEIKQAIVNGKNVLLYLNITKEMSEEPIYNKFDINYDKVKSFLIVGWEDYAYLTVKTALGVNKRHRGYFMVVPTSEIISEDNIHYIPYKVFDIGDKDDDCDFVKEVWSITNLDTDITEVERPGYKFKIGSDIIVVDGCEENIDAGAYYHSFGNPLVPVREVASRLGYKVKWNRFKRTIELTSHRQTIIIPIDRQYCYVNGVKNSIQFSVTINKYTKHAYMNLGFVRHILGLEAAFDKKTETVHIFTE